MIIADDGEMTEEKDGLYAELQREGHKIIICPFDSGFGYKSNRIADALERNYLLVGSDDFDFSPTVVRVGIEKMVAVLEENPILSVASGRVDSRPYERILLEGRVTKTVAEGELFLNDERTYHYADLTVNYSLISKNVFKTVRWDDDVKIGGGEHGAFFYDLMKSHFLVAYVPGVNINSQSGEDSPRYHQYRRRAARPERECFKKRGIKKYVLANGTIDYEEK